MSYYEILMNITLLLCHRILRGVEDPSWDGMFLHPKVRLVS